MPGIAGHFIVNTCDYFFGFVAGAFAAGAGVASIGAGAGRTFFKASSVAFAISR